jgi:hypothetical protein
VGTSPLFSLLSPHNVSRENNIEREHFSLLQAATLKNPTKPVIIVSKVFLFTIPPLNYISVAF